MRRLLVLATGALLALMLASPAQAAEPRIYHTIVSTLGYAVAEQVDGCTSTTAYVSSATSMYAAQPGPVGKQRATDVRVEVTDLCASAAAGGGPPVLAVYTSRVAVGVDADPQLTAARISAQWVDAATGLHYALDARWTGAGDLERTRGHSNLLFPGEGVLAASGSTLRRDVTATLSLHIGGEVHLASVPAGDAALERTRYRCVEVPRPGVTEFFPCFGFPG